MASGDDTGVNVKAIIAVLLGLSLSLRAALLS
jgi:hypothetical protein